MHHCLCHHCDHVYKISKEADRTICPRCCSKNRYKKSNTPLLFALILTCLILYIPANFFPMIRINLIGVMIPMTLTQGAHALFEIGFQFISVIIIVSCVAAPLLYLFALMGLFIALRVRSFYLFKYSMLIIHYAKHWAMLDVFLLSLGIAIFKLKSYADIYLEVGLYPFILLQMIISYLILNFSEEEYWDKWQAPQEHQQHDLIGCPHCLNTISYKALNESYKDLNGSYKDLNGSYKDLNGSYKDLNESYKDLNDSDKKITESGRDKILHCDRCGHHLHKYKPNSIQKTWAYLICALLFILPANLYPITVVISMGKNYTDTIMSGVVTLLGHEMVLIGLLIFTASILIPIVKIVSLLWILIAIQFKLPAYHRRHMQLYNFVQFVGKWSVMDLLVIAILTALLDRGQLLKFTPGFGAIAFGLVVVFTIFATESFDKKLIWADAKFNN